MAVGLKEVAALSRVSVSTASAALRGSAVNKKTKQRILKVASQLGYQPCGLARGLRLRKTNTIGLALPWTNVELMDGVLNTAGAQGYQVITEVYPEYDHQNEERVYQNLLGNRVDGAVILPADRGLNYSRVIERFRQHQIPIVSLEKVLSDMHVPSFGLDQARGAKLAWQHLIQLGRSPILFFGYVRKTTWELAKLTGVKEAQNAAGIPWREESMVEVIGPEGMNFSRIEKALAGARQGGAIFAASDHIALATIRVAHKMGIDIPKEVALVGFGDQLIGHGFRVCANTAPTISAIRSQHRDVARRATEYLLNMLDVEGSTKDQVLADYADLIDPRLVVRESCGGRPGVYGLDAQDRIYVDKTTVMTLQDEEA